MQPQLTQQCAECAHTLAMQSNSREQSRVFPTLGYSVAEVYNLFLSTYPL